MMLEIFFAMVFSKFSRGRRQCAPREIIGPNKGWKRPSRSNKQLRAFLEARRDYTQSPLLSLVARTGGPFSNRSCAVFGAHSVERLAPLPNVIEQPGD